MTRLLYSAREAAAIMGVGRNTVEDLWNTGQLAYVRLGRGRKVFHDEMVRWITDHQESSCR
ncbi:helix-turn-helix domain-containing protein [Tomitella gaofuii]|uniref:helix-turn-helix domain-containing protein n=1 Tax=Tomitella gaofuii TaxID=2760083 RepID=UPI0015FAED6A|nr:helix-turn-helix domain-containing protein [Tomitella gaofuii]